MPEMSIGGMMSLMVLVTFLLVSDGTAAPAGQGADGAFHVMVVGETVRAYTRPDSLSDVFGTIHAGDSVQACARSGDGWIGFEPGTAQGGNTGSFRYRWIPPDTVLLPDEDLSQLPVVWAPAAGVVYAQTFEAITVYSLPDSLSRVVCTMPGGSGAPVVLRTREWYLVDLSAGSDPMQFRGWVSSISTSISGDLETVPRRGIWRAFLSALTE